MSTVDLLVAARRDAGLSQRQLSRRSGIPQASISRIEAGRISPRATSIERWLAACGRRLDVRPIEPSSVDRSLLRDRLALTPLERSRLGVQEARALSALVGARIIRSRR
jgi:transcriptional regulator with XRE-family HTH domain